MVIAAYLLPTQSQGQFLKKLAREFNLTESERSRLRKLVAEMRKDRPTLQRKPDPATARCGEFNLQEAGC
jgi:hypothetical protein